MDARKISFNMVRKESLRTRNQTRLAPRVRESAIAGLALAVLLWGCGVPRAEAGKPPAQQVPEIAVVKAALRNLDETLTVSSELVPFQQIDVYAKEAGFVSELDVDYGTRVQKGQVMAVLEIPELKLQLDEDQASITDAMGQVGRARNELDRVQAVQKVAHLQYVRLSGVAKAQPGLVAQQEVDDMQGKDLSTEAQVEATRSALASAQSQLTREQAQLHHDQAIFAYAKITAPFAGVVTQRYANLGTLMQSGINSSTQAMGLVQLSEDDKFRLVIPVAESYVPYIHVGDHADVRVPVLNRTFPGTIARFSVDIREDTRTMHTEVDVLNPERVLVPGMYAEATLTVGRKPHALAVPQEAVNLKGDQRSVWVIDPSDKKVEERSVTTGADTPEYVEVASGLKPGEMVAVGNRSALQAGETVQPKIVSLARPPQETGEE